MRKASSVARIQVNVDDWTPSDEIRCSRQSAGNVRRKSLIDVPVAAINANVGQGRQPSADDQLERQMDMSMETMLRQWDAETTSVKISEGLHQAADRNGSSMARARTKTRVAPNDVGKCESKMNGVMCIGRLTAAERGHGRTDNDNNNNPHTVSRLLRRLDDSVAATRSLSETRCSDQKGQSANCSSFTSTPSRPTDDVDRRNVFHVEFDADGYQPDDITVHVTGTRLTIRGVRLEADDPSAAYGGHGLRRTTTEFCRRIRLPDDVNRDGLSCVMINGRLVVQAPRIHGEQGPADDVRSTTAEIRKTSSGSTTPPLNRPTVRTGDDEKHHEFFLMVDVGRVFRPDDVTVRVKNSTLTLTVIAERIDEGGCSTSSDSFDGTTQGAEHGLKRVGHKETSGGWRRLDARLAWEFDLPGPVDIKSLSAGLTTDGLLKITATMKQ